MGVKNRPEWSNVTSAGIFRVNTVNGKFDNHYHDCNEYWLVFSGKALVMSEDKGSM
jgi:mannose-6-phosphate isomerase-like protein (cupin superfamily)